VGCTRVSEREIIALMRTDGVRMVLADDHPIDTALELHPLVLERKGLAVALNALGRGASARGGFRANIRVDPEAAGLDDQLVLSVVRELLDNASKHSGAARVSVVVEREEDGAAIMVADDGIGIAADRPEQALSEGHIGLASIAERLGALGGGFEISLGPGGGTTAVARFPAPVDGRDG
jgi:two-component system, NarL family, sensor kinase